jgi:hypothetical protein
MSYLKGIRYCFIEDMETNTILSLVWFKLDSVGGNLEGGDFLQLQFSQT